MSEIADIMAGLTSVRTVDRLAEKFPAKWKWNRKARRWESEVGYAQVHAALAPRYDGDDGTFVRELIFYPNDAAKAKWPYPVQVI